MEKKEKKNTFKWAKRCEQEGVIIWRTENQPKNHIFPEKGTTGASIEVISHIMMKKKIFQRRNKSWICRWKRLLSSAKKYSKKYSSKTLNYKDKWLDVHAASQKNKPTNKQNQTSFQLASATENAKKQWFCVYKILKWKFISQEYYTQIAFHLWKQQKCISIRR